MATIQQQHEGQRVLLRNVTWRTYQALLADLGDHRSIRLTYDRGRLELMTPSHLHEYYKKMFATLIETLCLVLGIPMKCGGSTTFGREILDRGLEPDECYWVGNEALVRGKLEIDLAIDPPPDLAVEIDIASTSIDREGICAALRVPELWRFDGEMLNVLLLGPDGEYHASDRSPSFPFLSHQEPTRFLHPDPGVDETSHRRAFVAWVRDQGFPPHPGSEIGP